MRPLQDQCEPTPYQSLEAMFLSDMGTSIQDIFDDFDPVPIGVASLAQVHIGRHRESGRRVAVKVNSVQRPSFSTPPDVGAAAAPSPRGVLRHRYGDGRGHFGSVTASLLLEMYSDRSQAGSSIGSQNLSSRG